MVRLKYLSKKKKNYSDNHVLELVSGAAVHYKSRGITGELICCGDVCFQILEGEEEDLRHLFEEAITRHSSHSQVIKVSQETITCREYTSWELNKIDSQNGSRKANDPLVSMVRTLATVLMEKHETTPGSHFTKNGVEDKPSQVVDKIIFFCDIISFSTMSESMKPPLVMQLLNKYMEVVIHNIVSNGGQVSKLLGDGVMAYFNNNQGDKAVETSLGILSDLQDIRDNAGEGCAEKVLYTGIGLASGPVIEGSMGSDINNDVTIIGDSVNLASRLESMTRSQKVSLLISKEVKDTLKRGWDIMEMGKHIIKGKDNPLSLYSIRSPYTQKAVSGIEHEWEIRNYFG
ncbi:MAG: adenylate/guanylate cyclase domain-containing protein [Balneolales bacterium]